jgi:hypothetical protein
MRSLSWAALIYFLLNLSPIFGPPPSKCSCNMPGTFSHLDALASGDPNAAIQHHRIVDLMALRGGIGKKPKRRDSYDDGVIKSSRAAAGLYLKSCFWAMYHTLQVSAVQRTTNSNKHHLMEHGAARLPDRDVVPQVDRA